MGRHLLLSAGSNARGQLAQGSFDDSHIFQLCAFSDNGSDLPDGTHIVFVAAGANHTLVLTRSYEGISQLWGCGDGQKGQLGYAYLRQHGTSAILRRIQIDRDLSGSYLSRSLEQYTITHIAASWETTFVVLSHPVHGDVLLSVGCDDFGDLGVGGLQGKMHTDRWQVVSFSHLVSKGAKKMRIVSLKAGPHNVVVKLRYACSGHEEELVVGWGAARQEQLGALPPSSKKARQTQSAVASPHRLELPNAFDLSVGAQHTVFLTSEGRIFSFGSNRKNQLCTYSPSMNERVTGVGATWNGTYLLQVRSQGGPEEAWEILATGSNTHGQLARTPEITASHLQNIRIPSLLPGTQLLVMACGSEHVLLVVQRPSPPDGKHRNTEAWGWGWNEHGNLGLGHAEDVYTPTVLWPASNESQVRGQVVGVWAGCATSWIAVEVC